METWRLLWPFGIGYAAGSIPFAWLVVKAATGLDLRRVGSGNVGAANALRTARWRTGVAVAALDVAKGTAAVLLVALVGGDGPARVAGGLGAVVGHVAPVWLRFHGGKGVATAFGAFAVLAPGPSFGAAVVFAVTALVSRIVSVASLAGAVTLLGACVVMRVPAAVSAGAAVVTLLLFLRHRSNLERLARGTERRLGK